MPLVTPTPPDPAFLASLPGADFADAYCVRVTRQPLDARRVSALTFSQPPQWVSALMAARNSAMGKLGYKAPELRKGFPVLRESADEVVSGLDDGHLDFRVLTKVEATADGGSRITLTTVVLTHNRLGRIYLTIIKPFHKLIVRNMLRGIARRLEAEA